MSDFQVMPPLTAEKYAELEASILERGVLVPILIDENGNVIDGHHRQEIAQANGIECPEVVAPGLTDRGKYETALSLNIHRRHLTREELRDVLRDSIRRNPELSDRRHAEVAGASHPTAGAVRAELVSEGLVENLSTRVGVDGVAQPATKPDRAIVDAGGATAPQSGSADPDAARALADYLDVDNDPTIQLAKWRAAFSKSIHRMIEVQQFPIEDIAKFAEQDQIDDIARLLWSFGLWIEQVKAAQPQGLRLVNGAQS